MNLLSETRTAINESGHKIKDIVFIGSEDSGHSCSWDEFTLLADIEYDSGFGAQKVADDLIIVFSDGMKMWRHEYDGSEYWEFSTPFDEPEKKLPIHGLFTRSVGWDSLSTINE